VRAEATEPATFIDRTGHRSGSMVPAARPPPAKGNPWPTETDRARGIIAACEPIVREAEAYRLDVSEARTLLRQARDVLATGDSTRGLAFARNAEDAVLRLGPQITEERQRRGVFKPIRGVCGVCLSYRLRFDDDGWGACLECGSAFRWRRSPTLVERLRGLLGT